MGLHIGREKGQFVMVGEVKVTVERLSNKYVKLIFDGPRSVDIVRGELLARGNEKKEGELDIEGNQKYEH